MCWTARPHGLETRKEIRADGWLRGLDRDFRLRRARTRSREASFSRNCLFHRPHSISCCSRDFSTKSLAPYADCRIGFLDCTRSFLCEPKISRNIAVMAGSYSFGSGTWVIRLHFLPQDVLLMERLVSDCQRENVVFRGSLSRVLFRKKRLN